MQENELALIESLTGIDRTKIQFSDNGFWSRGYIIDNGRIVFKFKKTPDFSYQGEIDALNFVNTLDLGVNLQKVKWTSSDDAYLGMEGVIGEPLTVISKNHDDLNQMFNLDDIANQLGNAIRTLHEATPEHYVKISLNEELQTWQKRIFEPRNWATLQTFLRPDEIALVENFIRLTAPTRLHGLGEKPVLSHGDLYKNNIYIDETGKIGIIDFYQLQFLDEAADFMDMHNDTLREKILDVYGANEALRTKVKIRSLIRPIYMFGSYIDHQKATEQLQGFVKRMRRLIDLGYHEL